MERCLESFYRPVYCFFIAKWRRTLILRNLILAHSWSSRCPGTTKILNAFNYFYVLNAVVNLLRDNKCKFILTLYFFKIYLFIYFLVRILLYNFRVLIVVVFCKWCYSYFFNAVLSICNHFYRTPQALSFKPYRV